MAELDLIKRAPIAIEQEFPVIERGVSSESRTKKKVLARELYAKIIPFLTMFMIFTAFLSLLLINAKIYTVQKDINTNTAKVNLLTKENEGIKIELLKKSGIGSIEKSIDENIYVDIDSSKAIKADLTFDNFTKVKEAEKEVSALEKILNIFK